jgi:hypothetical protein
MLNAAESIVMIDFVAERRKRPQVKMNVSIEAKRTLERWADETSMSQEGTVSRIVEWFGRQRRTVQKYILGLIEADESPEVRKIADLLREPRDPVVRDYRNLPSQSERVDRDKIKS